ncbi:MAG: DUF1559 domain-containing protein, partial [Planctomycetota bacterium]
QVVGEALGYPCRSINSVDEGRLAARSRHPGGVTTVRLDDSVHFVTNGIDLQVWRAMSTMNMSEVFSDSTN